jgi:hypothetical protein
MMISPDLLPEQASELFEVWKTRLLTEKKRGEDFRMLSAGATDDASASNPRTERVTALLNM